MARVEDARAKWIEQRPLYEKFAGVVCARLAALLKGAGFYHEISARAKELESLVKKLLKASSKHTFESLPDKVGARVVVRYLSDLDRVLDLLPQGFTFGKVENKLDTLGHAEFGYLSIHVDRLALKASDPAHDEFPPEHFFAELQVRTMAQHLWSEISHDTVYKTVGAGVPRTLQRRVHLMAGQIEVADREFDRIGRELPDTPESHALSFLEPYYYRLSTRRPDNELSLEILRKLLPAFQLPMAYFATEGQLAVFLKREEAALAAMYDQAASSNVSGLVHQPEALFLYERLSADELGTRKAWNEHFPEEELQRLAQFFGISFE